MRPPLRRHPHLPQPRSQVLLRPVALDPIAVAAEQLQVLDVVGAAVGLRDDVVNLQVAELEGGAAAVAPAFLLAKEDVLVLAIGTGRVDVGAVRVVDEADLVEGIHYNSSALASFSRVD